MKKRILALALVITSLMCSCGGAKPNEQTGDNDKDLSSKYHISGHRNFFCALKHPKPC